MTVHLPMAFHQLDYYPFHTCSLFCTVNVTVSPHEFTYWTIWRNYSRKWLVLWGWLDSSYNGLLAVTYTSMHSILDQINLQQNIVYLLEGNKQNHFQRWKLRFCHNCAWQTVHWLNWLFTDLVLSGRTGGWGTSSPLKLVNVCVFPFTQFSDFCKVYLFHI